VHPWLNHWTQKRKKEKELEENNRRESSNRQKDGKMWTSRQQLETRVHWCCFVQALCSRVEQQERFHSA
jgi:hypothetical protein